MNEKLLQYIWQFQLYNKKELFTTDDKPLQILQHGNYNTNQGPDFLNASIIIDTIKWAGNIELHVYAGDWLKHNHQTDKNYTNVILHVVWNNDVAVNNGIPVFVLKERVAKLLLDKYTNLMQQALQRNCYNFLPVLNQLGWSSWKERLVIERLQRKAGSMLTSLQKNNNSWEEVFWQKIAANFGTKVNSDFFEAIAASIPSTILSKHKNQINQLEALLLGQANLLNADVTDSYARMLKKEYLFLRKKHNLTTLFMQPHFLRMRPANFPTIRLAQLAMLINNSTHLFSKIKEIENIDALKNLFNVTANDYWHYHYSFDEETPHKPKHLGEQMVQNIIINTIIPLIFAYGNYIKDEKYNERALQFLQVLAPEINNITKSWKGFADNKCAFDSQALIELTNNYCSLQKCLQCAVGNKILRS